MSDRLTLGQLRRDLAEYPDDAEVVFGGTVLGSELKFYRVKGRGEKVVQIELNEEFPHAGTFSVTVPEDDASIRQPPEPIEYGTWPKPK
jgi:hypothetical protein